MQRTSKTVWYKRAEIQGEHGSLRDLLIAALAALPKATERLQKVSEDGDQVGINLYQTHGPMLFGQFIAFRPGMVQPLLTIDSTKSAFDVEAIAAKEDSHGNKREFLESIAYFGIVGNHLLLVQTKVLTSRDFEAYLIWILQEATTALPPGTMLTLDDPAATAAATKAARANIRGITLGTQLSTVAVPETSRGQSVVRYELEGPAVEAIKGLLGLEVFDKLSLKDALEQDNIEVQLSVRVKGKRVISEEGQKFLRVLGRAARHFDHRDFALELDRNGELAGSDLRLHRAMSLPVIATNGLVDENTLLHNMVNWLQELLSKGLIES